MRNGTNTPRCKGEYKTKVEYYRHYKFHCLSADEHQCLVCNKVFNKEKYLKEHQKAHMDELPFKCELCGDYFKWRSGHKNHLDTEHKNKESLSDEFWVEGLVEVIQQYVLQNTFAQEFQSAHVHNNLSIFSKQMGLLWWWGSWLLQVTAQMSQLTLSVFWVLLFSLCTCALWLDFVF